MCQLLRGKKLAQKVITRRNRDFICLTYVRIENSLFLMCETTIYGLLKHLTDHVNTLLNRQAGGESGTNFSE